MVTNADPRRHEWVSKRNCALSPGQLAQLLAIPAVSSLLIAALFTSRGAWWVLVFAVIEVGCLVIAFLYYARHAGAYERVLLTPGRLVLEFHSGTATTREELDPGLARIDVVYARIPGFDGDGLVTVTGSGRTLQLGRFVPAAQRPALATWLRSEVRGAARRGLPISCGDPAGATESMAASRAGHRGAEPGSLQLQ